MAKKIRVRRVRASGQDQLRDMVLPIYDQEGASLSIKVLLARLKDEGYTACYKCDNPAHELALFRKKLAIPHIRIEGIKARLFFPTSRNQWVSLLHVWKEALRGPDAADAPDRRKKFEEMLELASGREFLMRMALHNNATIRDRIKMLTEQGVLYEQEPLPFEHAQ